MTILITDWGDIDQVIPIAFKYQVGLELLEYADPENFSLKAPAIEATRQKIKPISLLSIHGPFSELVPATRDPMVREVTRKRFQQAYDLAQMLGASHMIFHSGFIPKTYPRDIWIKRSLAFWVDFLRDKPEKDMIHVENVYEDDFRGLQELVDQVNQVFSEDRLTICLDIGHVNANSSYTLPEWIKVLGNRIRYAHLHNNDGVLDDHWKLDKGEIDIDEVLNLLSKHAPNALWTIETSLEDIEPSLLWLQKEGYL